jgi:hypothetical protein
MFRTSKDSFYKKKNLVEDSTKIEKSPSGKYELEISKYKTRKGCWNYSKGVVYKDKKKPIEIVKRNYHHFPFEWVESHPNGHDYLICGEDYQGQTIIELDTGKRIDYLPEAAKRGFGFCWVAINASPNKTTLAVDGCVWAGPYEVLFVDFSEPMKELKILENQPEGYGQEFFNWNEDGTANIGYEKVRRKSDEKWEEDLSDKEQDKMYDDEDYEEVPIKTPFNPRSEGG